MPKAIRIAEILIIILFFAAAYSGFAQTTDASLTGQVTDQVGAALPNATVSVKNVGTTLLPSPHRMRRDFTGFHPYLQELTH